MGISGGICYQDDNDIKEALALSGRIFGFNTSIKEVQKDGDLLEISNSVCELAEVRFVLKIKETPINKRFI